MTTPTHLEHNFLKRASAGAIASFMGRFISQPLEVIKLQVQIQNKINFMEKKSIPRIASDIWKYDGVKGFFRGHNASQVLGVAQGAAQFWGFDKVKNLLDKTALTNQPELRDFLGGCIAGSISVIILNPLDTLKTRVISQKIHKSTKKNIPQMYSKTLYNEGIRALFRGTSVGIIQVAPLIGFRFMFFNFFCSILSDSEDEKPSGYVLLISGALSGAFSNGLTYPTDVIRRRMQLTKIRKQSNRPFDDSCKKMMVCVLSVQKQYGLGGFYLGITPGILKSAVGSAVTFWVYEKLMEFYN